MNKEYIESLLREEVIVSTISKLRTQFNNKITEFYFFKVFIEVLQSLGIKSELCSSSYINNDNSVVTDYKLTLWENENNKYKCMYDHDKLLKDLDNYNAAQEGKGMHKSAHDLIDIFIGLLE